MTVTDFSNNARFASFYTPVSFEPDVVGVIISLKRSQHLTNPKLFVRTVELCVVSRPAESKQHK